MRVTVIYHQEAEGWWAESTEAPSFFATGPDQRTVQQFVREALPRVLGAEPLTYTDVVIPAAAVAVSAEQGWHGDGGQSSISSEDGLYASSSS